MHAQLATLIVASPSSILPWQHHTCIILHATIVVLLVAFRFPPPTLQDVQGDAKIAREEAHIAVEMRRWSHHKHTSNVPRHTKHNHAPGDHPHAATSELTEATRESSVAPRTHTARASCTFASASLVSFGSPHGALIVLSFLQVACTNGEVVRCRCARPRRPRLSSNVATHGSGSRLSSCRMSVATRRACGGPGRADRAIGTSPGASGSVSSPDPPSRRARVGPEGPSPISPSSHRRDATGDDHHAQDATDAGGSGPRPHYSAPRPASSEPPGFKPAIKCPGRRLFGSALPSGPSATSVL